MKNLFPVSTLSLLGAFSLLVLTGCSPVAFQAADHSNGEKYVTDPLEPVHPDQCYKEVFNQPTQKVGQLDILFVTDTSGSLDDERAAVADGIDSFVAGLSNGVDYSVAVMLAHGSTSAYSGKLYQAGTEPLVLTKAMGQPAIRAALKTKLTTVVGDPVSDGGEEGLYSVNHGVTTAALLAQSQAAGFFRPDAALAVIFISDENDICAIYPAGVTPVPDGDGKEGPANAMDCGNVNANTVYANLKALKGQKPLLVNSVIYIPGQPVPAGGENEIGYGYLDITQLSKGLSVYLGGSNTDIANGLFDVGQLADSKLSLILNHTLGHTGTIASIDVVVDGQSAKFNYDQQTNEVEFLEPGGSGSEVDVNYCVSQ